jgi:hypothetical protein
LYSVGYEDAPLEIRYLVVNRHWICKSYLIDGREFAERSAARMLLSNARQLPCCQQCPQLFRAIKPARVAMHQKKLHHQPTLYAKQQQFRPLCSINAKSQVGAAAAAAVQPESQVAGMSAYLDSLRWSKDGLVPVIVQVHM